METYDALLASITPASGETRTILDPATGQPVGRGTGPHRSRTSSTPSPPQPAAQPAWAALGHEKRGSADC